MDDTPQGGNAESQGDEAPEDPRLAAALAERDALKSERDKLRDEAAKRRIAAKEAEGKERQALMAKGDLENAAALQEAKIAELEARLGAIEPKAKAQEEYEAAAEARIAERLPELPKDVQDLLASAESLAQKRKILRVFDTQAPKAKASTTADAASPPSPDPALRSPEEQRKGWFGPARRSSFAPR